MQLWVEKYKPKSTKEILSQHKAVDTITGFLQNWKPGKALLFYGPPGTGKTLLAETTAKERGWMLTTLNASDKRNTDSIETQVLESSKNHSLFSKGKLILIDEIDGLSGTSDRGGTQAVIRVIKESKFPVILTANDAYSQKLRTLRNHCVLVKFSKVNSLSIAKRLGEICSSEGIKVEGDVLKNLARWCSGDMRSAVTDLQTICQGTSELKDDDLLSLGFREKGTSVFDILPAIFKSKNPKAAKKAMWECDKGPDEIFWWVESNIHSQFREPDALAKAFDLLSKADMYRQRVMKQQNWAFKGYMVDMMSGISLSGETSHGFVPFKPPDKLIMMGRSKVNRAAINKVADTIGLYTHSSRKVVRKEFLPLVRLILKNKIHSDQGVELKEDDAKAIVSG